MGDHREGCIEQIRLEHGCDACAERKRDEYAGDGMYCDTGNREWIWGDAPEACDMFTVSDSYLKLDYPDMDRDNI